MNEPRRFLAPQAAAARDEAGTGVLRDDDHAERRLGLDAGRPWVPLVDAVVVQTVSRPHGHARVRWLQANFFRAVQSLDM
jgi:hypothetical protein